jgi:tetratricopeptide (TPR) repeat protein
MAEGTWQKGKGKFRRIFRLQAPAVWFYSIALISAVLAMKTKENAFTLPLIITLYEFCFFSPSPHVSASSRLRVPLSPRLLYLAPILLTLAIIPLTLMSISGQLQLDPGSYGGKVFSRGAYLFTEFRVLITYLRLIFFPINQNIYYVYPAFHSFFAPQVVLSFIFLAAIFAFGVYLVKQAKGEVKVKTESLSAFSQPQPLPQPAFRLIGFGILWFFITISVESSVIPLYMLICEYRVYLPSVGVSIAVITGLFLLFNSSAFLPLDKRTMGGVNSPPKSGAGVGSRLILVALVLAIGGLSVATYRRNEVWGDKVRLWKDTTEKSPENPFAHYNLGNSYKDHNMFDEAIEQYQAALNLKPDYYEALNNLGIVYKDRNMPDKAMEEYMIALGVNPDRSEAHNNLGMIYKERYMLDKAMEHYLIAIKQKPDFAEAHNNLGNTYLDLNMYDKAVEEYKIAINLKPDYAEAHDNLGLVWNDLNILDEAIKQYKIAINLKPDDAEAYFNLGFVYFRKGQMENARKELKAALKIKPDDQKALQLLERILIKTN